MDVIWTGFDPRHDALFLDADGTLLDIAPRAQDVVVSQTLIEDLKNLSHHLTGALALISGRTIANLDELFAPLTLPCSGAHGAQFRPSAQAPIRFHPPIPDSVKASLTEALKDLTGVIIEDKGQSIAIHFRQTPQHEPKVAAILRSVLGGSNDPDLTLMKGRKVMEILHGTHDKGKAVEQFMAVEPFHGRRPVFLGDDVTDLAAIDTCRKNGGIGFRVGKSNNPHEMFDSPQAVRKWLHHIACLE